MAEIKERKSIPPKMRFEVFKRDSFTCQYCGKMAPDIILEVDHIKPVCKGGNNGILNLITSCFECNRGKGGISLNENEVLKKQQEQLKELSEKKKQLEMLVKWKEELQKQKDLEVDEIEKLFYSVTKRSFTAYGSKKINSLIKKFGFSEIYDCTRISLDKYYDEDDDSNKAFNYIGRIAWNNEKSKTDPFLYNKNIFKKSLRNASYSYIDWKRVNKILEEEEMNEQNLQFMLSILKNSRNWTIFIKEAERWHLE